MIERRRARQTASHVITIQRRKRKGRESGLSYFLGTKEEPVGRPSEAVLQEARWLSLPATLGDIPTVFWPPSIRYAVQYQADVAFVA